MIWIHTYHTLHVRICAILSIMPFESTWNPFHIFLKVDVHVHLICYLPWHFLSAAGDEIAMRDLYIPPLGLLILGLHAATWTKPKLFSWRVFQGETAMWHSRHSAEHRVDVADVAKFQDVSRCFKMFQDVSRYSLCRDPMCLKNPKTFFVDGRDPERTPMQWTPGRILWDPMRIV